MTDSISDVIFSDAIRAAQTRYGSRGAIAGLEARGRWKTEISDDVAAFIATRDSFYLGTASRQGRPYIQHRGGPRGFIRVLDRTTLLWPEYRGNRQYISTGNLTENAQAFIFLMDYAEQRRIKLWGRAAVVEDARSLSRPLEDVLTRTREADFERAIRFDIEAWDENCRQYITPRYSEAQAMHRLMEAEATITSLRAEIEALKSGRIGN